MRKRIYVSVWTEVMSELGERVGNANFHFNPPQFTTVSNANTKEPAAGAEFPSSANISTNILDAAGYYVREPAVKRPASVSIKLLRVPSSLEQCINIVTGIISERINIFNQSGWHIYFLSLSVCHCLFYWTSLVGIQKIRRHHQAWQGHSHCTNFHESCPGKPNLAIHNM